MKYDAYILFGNLKIWAGRFSYLACKRFQTINPDFHITCVAVNAIKIKESN